MRFILIDHSIVDLAGHHYEYAMHVLRAAEKAGYEPILATNRGFREHAAVPWKVLPLYEFGFWPEAKPLAGVKALLQYVRKIRAAWFHVRCRLQYSTIGLAWISRFQWRHYLQRRPAAGRNLVAWLAGLALIAAFKFLRTFLMLALLPLALTGLILWTVWATLRYVLTVPVRAAAHIGHHSLPFLARRYFDALRNEVKTYREFTQFFRRLFSVAMAGRRRSAAAARERLQSTAFGRDTETLLDRLQPDAEDVFFIPTIATRDMLGLVDVLIERPAAARASWHLLFRRNLYHGTRGAYAQQDASLEEVRQAFQYVRQRSGQVPRICFYTDTDELTHQYNRLGVFPFHTVPIPHTYSPEDRPAHGPALRITYLGDARGEKGFHLLPALVADLQAEYLRPARAQFVVQCNYNIPGGEAAAAVARSQLEGLSRKHVRLYPEPLTSSEYKELLLSADINLLLYDRLNYYARSSGILVESLAAGVPVVVPSGSWLARQFLEPYYAWQEHLREEFALLRSVPHTALSWHRQGNPGRPVLVGGELRAAFEEKAACRIEVPAGSTHVLVAVEWSQEPCNGFFHLSQLDWSGEVIEESQAIYLEGAGATRRAAFTLSLLPGIYKIAVAFGSAGPQEESRIYAVRFDFLRAPRDRSVPLGAVGMIYHSEDEIPVCVANMIDHYPHFQQTALAFAETWRQYHHAGQLLADLESVAGIVRPVPAPGPIQPVGTSAAQAATVR